MSMQEQRRLASPGDYRAGARAPMRERPERDGRRDGGSDQLASALGWLSLGLGLAGLVAPREVARFIGVPDDDRTRDLLRTVGAREVISGLGILTQPRPTGWVWSRVAGDVMDLALLSSARGAPGVHRDRLATATAAVAGITALDLYAGQELSRAPVGEAERARRRHWQGDSQRAKSITVNRSPEEVYGYWRDFRNLARFMKNVLSVEETGDRRTHWRVRGPAGSVVEWDAEIVEDRPGELIAWRSLPGSEVHHCGRVRFRPAPGDRGTEIHVEMEYAPPGGAIGETVAFLFGKDPRQQLGEDLRRFKQVLETGEVVVSEGSINGIQFPQHAGQPPTEEDLARSEWRRAA